MLSAGGSPAIKSVSKSGPTGSLKGKISKSPSSEEDSGDVAQGEKTKHEDSGTEFSIDAKLKRIFSKTQKIDPKNDGTNDNSSRFDSIAGEQFGSSPEIAASRYGLYPPPQGAEKGFDNLKNQVSNPNTNQSGNSIPSTGPATLPSQNPYLGGTPQNGGGAHGGWGGVGGCVPPQNSFDHTVASLAKDTSISGLEVDRYNGHPYISFSAEAGYQPKVPPGYSFVTHEEDGKNHYHIFKQGENSEELIAYHHGKEEAVPETVPENRPQAEFGEQAENETLQA